MFPNPNEWLLVKALDDARRNKAPNRPAFRTSVSSWSIHARIDSDFFSRIQGWIDSILLKIKPMEECGCQGCCPAASVSPVTGSL